MRRVVASGIGQSHITVHFGAARRLSGRTSVLPSAMPGRWQGTGVRGQESDVKSTTPRCPSALADALALRGDAVSKASERKQGQADRADVFCKGVYLAIRSSRSGYLLRAHNALPASGATAHTTKSLGRF